MRVGGDITIDEGLIEERFVRASGPGGQNVNKVSTAVELRFDATGCRNLSGSVRERLLQLAGRRATSDGVIVIQADRFRSQERNRTDARQRLQALIRQALHRPKTRIATKPSRAAKERRLEAKQRRGMTKKMRQSRPSRED